MTHDELRLLQEENEQLRDWAHYLFRSIILARTMSTECDKLFATIYENGLSETRQALPQVAITEKA